LVSYYRGDFREQVHLLGAHRDLAESLADKAKLGMFYAWYGFSLFFRGKSKDSYEYLRKALEMGEQIEDQQVIGYACTWLSWTCADLGALEEAILCGERAQEISKHIPSDHYLFFKSLGGIGTACYYKGNRKRALEAGTAILDYGQRHSNIRSIVMGHFVKGFSFGLDGDFPSAIEAFKKAIQTAQDPFYYQCSRYFLGTGYAQNGQFQEAEAAFQEVAAYSRDFGCEVLGTPTDAMLGLLSIAQGRMGHGLNMMEEALQACLENQRRYVYARIEHYLGQVYLQIVEKSAPVSLTTMAKNVGFILKNVPSAAKKAVEHFHRALEVAEEIGAKSIQGQVYVGLGRLHKAKGRSDQAQDCFSKAARIFRKCEAKVYLKQANEALESLI
jgi:tetratricopeptide (TPR) repeat protein